MNKLTNYLLKAELDKLSESIMTDEETNKLRIIIEERESLAKERLLEEKNEYVDRVIKK